MSTEPATPLASTMAVSLVEVSVSTETQLNVRSMTRRKMVSSDAGSMSASVNMSVMSVAMFGSIMPTPLATPTTTALEPEIVADATFSTVSVVMMPVATA